MSTKRDGSAELGVSISPRKPPKLAPPPGPPAAELLATPGGAGRANGFGGPVAPALRSALALGEGGGRTTPEGWSPPALAGVADVWPDSLGDSSPPFSASEPSVGICTFNRGRLACMLFVREGVEIAGIDDVEEVRCGCVRGGLGELPLGC